VSTRHRKERNLKVDFSKFVLYNRVINKIINKLLFKEDFSI